ncbi:MAG: DMT family transporter [Acidimicrobiales bacterium]
MSRRGTLLFAAMCVIWGIPYLLIKVAVRDLSAPMLVFCRTGIGAAVLLPVAMARGDLAPLRARWRALLAYTVVELAIPWVLLSTAEKELPSSLTGLLVAAVPLVGFAMAWRLGDRDALGRRNAAGLVIGLVGVGALVGFDGAGADIVSVAIVGVVVVGYAAGPLILARVLHDMPGLGVVAASLGLCALGYAPIAAFDAPSSMPSGRVVASVVVLGLVCTAMAFIIFFELIREIGPVRATIITYVNPAVAVVLGVAFLHESLGVASVVGFVLILIGSVLATTRGRPGATVVAVPAVAEP